MISFCLGLLWPSTGSELGQWMATRCMQRDLSRGEGLSEDCWPGDHWLNAMIHERRCTRANVSGN